jgi:hypothetical protein
MSEPRKPETTNRSKTTNKNEGLTTEQFANAGATTGQVEGEPRSFKPDGEPEEAQGASTEPIFPENEAADLRHSWESIQAGFVDEPRRAVEGADHLVAATMKRLAEMFAQERSRLESQWDRGDDVSTEELRVALQRYRAFFGRLLAV